jgi:hypothetical protein
LNLLPIPEERQGAGIAKVAKTLQETSDEKKRKKLFTSLNDMVAAAYGLDNAEREFIAKFLRSRRGYD